jgi:hypothetical protein
MPRRKTTGGAFLSKRINTNFQDSLEGGKGGNGQ